MILGCSEVEGGCRKLTVEGGGGAGQWLEWMQLGKGKTLGHQFHESLKAGGGGRALERSSSGPV